MGRHVSDGLEHFAPAPSPSEDQRLLREAETLNAELNSYVVKTDRSRFELASLLAAIRHKRVIERTMGRRFMSWAVEVVTDKDGRPIEKSRIQSMLREWGDIVQYPAVVAMFRQGYTRADKQVFPSWTRCYTACRYVSATRHESKVYTQLAAKYREDYGMDPCGEDMDKLNDEANDAAGAVAVDLIRTRSTDAIREMHQQHKEEVPSYGDEEPMVLIGATKVPKSIRDMFKAGAVKLARFFDVPRREHLSRAQEYELYAQFVEDVADAVLARGDGDER